MKRVTIFVASAAVLSACVGGGSSSPFQEDGLQDILAYTQYRGGSTSSAAGTGYVYNVGTNSDGTGLASDADLSGPSTLPDPPNSGTATMNGRYELRTYQGLVDIGGGVYRGTGLSRNGNIALATDFSARTLSGETNGLEIDGRFGVDGTLSGTVTYSGMDGQLGGDISGTDAIGVFEGGNRTGVFAGGFIVSN